VCLLLSVEADRLQRVEAGDAVRTVAEQRARVGSDELGQGAEDRIAPESGVGRAARSQGLAEREHQGILTKTGTARGSSSGSESGSIPGATARARLILDKRRYQLPNVLNCTVRDSYYSGVTDHNEVDLAYRQMIVEFSMSDRSSGSGGGRDR
jgi:hypothetical protein